MFYTSLSFGIRDIVENNLSIEDCYISSSTKMESEEDLKKVLDHYSENYWSCNTNNKVLAKEMYVRGWVGQPRVRNCENPCLHQFKWNSFEDFRNELATTNFKDFAWAHNCETLPTPEQILEAKSPQDLAALFPIKEHLQ